MNSSAKKLKLRPVDICQQLDRCQFILKPNEGARLSITRPHRATTVYCDQSWTNMDDKKDLRIFFRDSDRDLAKSVVAKRGVIRSRPSVFQTAAELPADGEEILCEATDCKNGRALQHYLECAK